MNADPTIPKTWVTPFATIVSTKASEGPIRCTVISARLAVREVSSDPVKWYIRKTASPDKQSRSSILYVSLSGTTW
jgi:hypothetical protein